MAPEADLSSRRRPLLAALLGTPVFVGLAIALADGQALVSVAGAGRVGAIGQLALLGAALGGVVAFALIVLDGIGAALAARAPGRLRPWLRTLPTAAVVSAGLVPVVLGSLDGAGISAWRWLSAVRVALLVLAPLGAWCAVTLLRGLAARLSGPAPAGWVRAAGWGITGALLVAWPTLIVLDRAWLLAYGEFHLFLAALLAAAAAVVGVGLALLTPLGRSRAFPVAGLLLGASSIAIVGTGSVPTDDTSMRRALRVEAPIAAKLLGLLLPVAETDGEAGSVPASLRELVGPRPATPPAELDRAFPGRRDWNVLWITIDTLRADHTGRGYARDVTPQLDALADRGVVFEHAYTPYPSSQLAMAAMFTGRYPSATEVARLKRSKRPWEGELATPHLSELLGAAGRRCEAVTAFSAASFQPLFWYLPKGFDAFQRSSSGRWLTGDVVAERTLKALGGLGAEPWFLWVHLFDPHDPYEAPEPHAFGDRPVDDYDAEVRFADRQLGRILQALDGHPQRDRTLVIVHSDHGEEFLDHGGWRHGSSLYDEQVRVPLVIDVPGGKARKVRGAVGLVDLLPTVLELLGLDVPADVQGRSLVPYLLGDADPARVPGDATLMEFSERYLRAGRLQAVRSGDFKLIHNLGADTFELYDVRRDPGEKTDLSARRPDALARMRAVLQAFRGLLLAGTPRAEDRHAADTALARTGRGTERLGAVLRLLAAGAREPARDALAEAARTDAPAGARAEALRVARRYGLALPLETLDPCSRDEAPAVRAEAVLAVAFREEPEAAAIRRRARDDGDPLVRAATLVSRGLRGDASAVAGLRALVDDPGRPLRGLALVALARLDDADERAPLLQTLVWGTVTPECAAAAVELFIREPRARDLQALYQPPELSPHLSLDQKFRFRKASFEQRGDATPLLRRALVDADQAVRKAARKELERAGRKADIAPLRAAERRLLSTRGPLREGRALEEVCTKVLAANERLRARGVSDWGLALEAWWALVAAGRYTEAASVTDAARKPANGEVVSASARFLTRLSAVARSLQVAPAPELRLESVDDVIPSPGKPWLLRFSLSLAEDGGALPGGRMDWLPAIRFKASPATGGPKLPLARLPLPVEGLLPGERREFLMILPTPVLAPGSYRMSLDLVWKDRVLHDEVAFTARRP